MNSGTFPVEITAPSRTLRLQAPIVKSVFPNLIGWGLSKVDRHLVIHMTEGAFLKRVNEGDSVYVWSDVSTEFMRALKRKNVLIFREKFNGLKLASKEILDAIYLRNGLEPNHAINENDIAIEMEQMEIVDYIFLASPILVTQFVARGIVRQKIIQSTYGWDPRRCIKQRIARPANEIVVVFVGVSSLRKGVDLLLDSWRASKINGQLILAGPIDADIVRICSDALNENNVVKLGWVEDVASVYQRADIFAFPSHEESGPLVTYEAMGCGLPVIVSPMGAGAIARHGIEGFVIDPYDRDGWIEGLRRLATDHELRRRFAHNAAERAKEFTWDKVGAARRQAVLERQSRSTQANAIKADAHPRFA